MLTSESPELTKLLEGAQTAGDVMYETLSETYCKLA